MPQRLASKVSNKTFDPAAAGAFLRARREKLGMSQRDVADQANVSQRTIVKIEHGLGSVTVQVLEAAAAALGLDILQVIKKALR